MIKAKWLIDKQIIKDTRYENLEQIIKDIGYEVTVKEYIPFSRPSDYLPLPYNENDCVVVYGTIEFVKMFNFYNGVFLNFDRLKFSNYFSTIAIDSSLFLNSDFVLTTLFDFKTNFSKYSEMFGTDKLFIRPDSGFKLFTGLPIDNTTYLSEINALEQLSGAENTSIILVSKSKNIQDEYRFIIAGNEIIGSSSYSYNGKSTYLKNHSNTVEELALKIANAKNKPSECFTADICTLENNDVKIVELNSFSSAGWYGADPKNIIIKVSQLVEKMYNDLNV